MGEKGGDTLEEGRSGERTDQGLAAAMQEEGKVARGSDVADGATEGGQPTEQLGLSEASRAAAYEEGKREGLWRAPTGRGASGNDTGAVEGSIGEHRRNQRNHC